MNKYKIEAIEVKTASNNNKYAVCDLIDLDINAPYPKKVTLWLTDWPNAETITFGSEVSGEIKINDKGYATLYPPKQPTSRGGANIAKAQERKEQSINKTLDRKEDNIRMAAIMRDTTLLATAELNAYPDADLKLLWKKWHEFLVEQWN